MALQAEMAAEELAELDAKFQEISKAVEETLDELLPKPDGDDESRLYEAMRYSVFAGGKRVRPFLIYTANEALGGKPKRALRVAAAMEVLHTYSLIHDDLPAMDDDDLRRGKPTCHVQFDEATAILAGDALLTLAFEILSHEDTHPEARVRCELVQLFAVSAGARGMVGGQMIDMIAETRTNPLDQGALARLQRKKTGALFAACCEAAAVINGATRAERASLSSYARNLGLAFQMADDILDVIGDEKTLGKRVKKDANRNKATFATLLGIDAAKRQAEFLVAQACDYLNSFGDRAHFMKLLARFIIARAH